MMSVVLATMEAAAAYGLNRLPMPNHNHHHQQQQQHFQHLDVQRQNCSASSRRSVAMTQEELELEPRSDVEDGEEQAESSAVADSLLRFSIVNILRPDFGRAAILSTRSFKRTSSIKVTAIQNPLALPRDLSQSSSTSSSSSSLSSSSSPGAFGTTATFPVIQKEARDSLSSHSELASPIQRHSSNLSRSGSLESLASNRSSVSGSLANGLSSSISSSSSGPESLNGDSTNITSTSSLPNQNSPNGQSLWPAWIYCTRYSDRPSSGPRTRRVKRTNGDKSNSVTAEEKRPRTAFSAEQLTRLRHEFAENRYLTEPRRQKLSKELGLNEQQIKIWFQNKRAKIKKASGQKNPLALQLMAQGLYNHSTVPVDDDGEDIIMNQD